jgi:acyl phosphate:glycerol-3-phosphate acyltransferase
MLPILVILSSYLIGAIPFGYLIARCRGVDIFAAGSGNIGATNVGRVLGRKYGILVFALDFAKGAVPVLIAGGTGEMDHLGWIDWPANTLRVLAGLCAFIGHVFPVYLAFHGGKGVATGAGVAAMLLPLPMLAALIVWVAVAASWRMVSLASLAATVFLCGWRLMTPQPFGTDNIVLTSFCLVITVLVFWRHRENLVRLVHGKENQLRENRVMANVARIVHVLSLGLWFGMSVFFNLVVGTTLFDTFWQIGKQERSERPNWFPVAKGYDRDPETEWPKDSGPRPLKDAAEVRREQGTRAAGAAVGPLLTWYFVLQGFCGLLALVTSMGWSAQDPGSRVHRWRTWVLIAALLTVLMGWPLEYKVSKLNVERNESVDKLLAADTPDAETLSAATDAKHTFVLWHTMSLGLSLVGVMLVTVAMAMASRLPATSLEVRSSEKSAP